MADKGEKVLYSPDDCHVLDRDRAGAYLFRFVYADGPKRDQEVPNALIGTARRGASGQPLRINGGSGFAIRPVGPRYFWAAVVEARHGNDTADLTVTHPSGGIVLSYAGVKHSAKKEPHTWHKAQE